MEKAIFALGCFWGVRKLFDNTRGVTKTIVGYTGGNKINPSYEEVCSDKSGHAESIEIEYDEKIITYKELLKLFFENHNPTTINRQGPDVGSQYRSAIFYINDKQKKEAEKFKKEYQKKMKNKIVTQIVKASIFYPAEEYHQKYLEKNKNAFCHI